MKYIDIRGLRVVPVLILGIVAALFTTTASRADTPAAKAGDTAAAEVQAGSEKKQRKKKKSKMICTRERVTGSHMRQRVCRTAEQIEQRRLDDQRNLNALQRPSSGGSSG